MQSLRKLVRYKAWANELVFDAVARMPETALVAPQPIVFGNLLRTLNHVLAMDHVWRAHLTAKAHGLITRNPEYCPNLSELREAQREMDAWYIAYANSLDAASGDEIVRFAFIGGRPGAMTRADIVLHTVNHGTYHRGHIAQMMRTVEPAPITDYPVFLQGSAAV